jgi:hypothetical protein
MNVIAIMRLHGDVLGAFPSPQVTGATVYRRVSTALQDWRPDECLVLIETADPPPPRRKSWTCDGTIVRIWLSLRHWDMRDAVAARYGVPVELPPRQRDAIYGITPRMRHHCRRCW